MAPDRKREARRSAGAERRPGREEIEGEDGEERDEEPGRRAGTWRRGPHRDEADLHRRAEGAAERQGEGAPGMSALQSAVVAAYFGILLSLALYGLHRYHLLRLYDRA